MRKQTVVNATKILFKEGPVKFIKHTVYHINYMNKKKNNGFKYSMKDVLFINGCPIDYCERYRVHHKMEELIANNLTVDEVVPSQLYEDTIKYYRAFVIYRAPWTEHLDKFVKLCKENNKIVFYDIDDLVFDLKYTNNIKELDKLSKEHRDEYDDGVIRYGKMLDCCDYGITTTKVIAEEMKKHVKDACIDKNIASLDMQFYSEKAIKNVEKDSDKIIIGYASGSVTHNADFQMISSAIKKIMDKYDNVYFNFIGAISIPDDYKKYRDRIIVSPFVDFKQLPAVLRKIDINLAPLEDTFFNSAKSSIKWMEAAFVKIPTVASDVGNFRDCITDGVDGYLCKENEWYDKIEKLVIDSNHRKEMGENAYKTVYSSYTPITSGHTVADFIKSKLNKNIMFIIPSANISGGVMVATKHAAILKKHGYDVSLLNTDLDTKNVKRIYDNGTYINVISMIGLLPDQEIDVLVGTMWFTITYAKSYPKCNKIKYLVQGKESQFYGADRVDMLLANATYRKIPNVEYLTVSKWCQNWLKNEFDVDAKYVPNGIDLSIFPYKERNFANKINILIEGDSSSFYKNVDESFKIANKLDKNKYNIIYLSYNAKQKEWYNVDKSYNKVNHDEVYKIYQEADILLKSSYLESFSYPPLEMMATGGIAVVVPNDGNIEYLTDEENCLMYELGNIDEAIGKIERISNDRKLREKLIKNGKKTAEERSWDKIEKSIIDLYEK